MCMSCVHVHVCMCACVHVCMGMGMCLCLCLSLCLSMCLCMQCTYRAHAVCMRGHQHAQLSDARRVAGLAPLAG